MLTIFTPDLIVPSVCDIPLPELAGRGIRGLLFDLDNTLLAHRGDEFEDDVIAWLKHAAGEGFGLYIISNGPPSRTLRLAEKVGLPAVYHSGKPGVRGLRQALDALGLKPAQAAMVGDQIFTDVWAGSRLGLYTVLVTPINADEPWNVRVKRPLERFVLRRINSGQATLS
ncbi:MAG: YqeG family HAD IIIA-type phosphatase [Anaerolineae bacterium]